MAYQIWTSLPIDLLKEEFKRAGVSQDAYRLTASPTAIETSDILFGAMPRKASLPSRIQWLQLDSSDTRGYESTAAQARVTHLSGVFSQVIAESILGSVLGATRGLFGCVELQPRKKWQQWKIRSSLVSLQGARVVILGGGAIARSLVRLLAPFHCTTTIYRRQPTAKDFDGCEIITSEAELDHRLPNVDLVVNALPASDATKGFLSAQRLEKIHRDAVLVNAGRGITTDEKALLRLLKKGRFRFVVLDVTATEPLPKSSPLWPAKRVLITHHTFGGHRDELRWKCRFFVENFLKFTTAGRLVNEVNG